MFITGASEIPPMGFLSRGYIDFEHDSSRKLPSVSTCSLTLTLPIVLIDIIEFQKAMGFAIICSPGFGIP